MNYLEWRWLFLAIVLSTFLLGYFFSNYTAAAVPWLDATLAAISLAAQWMISYRKKENWWLWIFVNVIYIPLYYFKDLPLTALLYGVFLIMAIRGWYAWNRVEIPVVSSRNKKNCIRIAILGPESTGKSILAESLAKHFQTSWAPEYARNYLQQKVGKYSIDDVLHCARNQQWSESEAIGIANAVVFFDTEMINFKVWLEDRFQHCPGWISKNLNERYDCYLLTVPDLPFEEDPLRENPHRRDHLFAWYKHEVENAGIPYALVSGEGNIRFENACDAVNKFLANH